MDEEAAKELYTAMLKEQDESEAEPLAQLIKTFKANTNLSIRKIAAIAGINKDRVNTILRSYQTEEPSPCLFFNEFIAFVQFNQPEFPTARYTTL